MRNLLSKNTAKKLWLTYAWKDNEDKDIDYIIQELDSAEIDVHFDRRSLVPGQPLWSQIADKITNSEMCDAWGIILTPNSINSRACIEELAYALDRALSGTDDGFPLFALFHKISSSDAPKALKIRLGIHLTDQNWKHQVVAAVNRQPVGAIPGGLDEFILKEHDDPEGAPVKWLEIRSRIQRIAPFAIAVEVKEKERKKIKSLGYGIQGQVQKGGTFHDYYEGESELPDGTRLWCWQANNALSPTDSYYLMYNLRPTRIWFGPPNDMIVFTFPIR